MRPEELDQNEPILRGEYEKRHETLRAEYGAYARRSTRILRVLVLLLVANMAVTFFLLRENGKRTEQIQDSLVENCQKSGNPQRAAIRLFGHTLVEQYVKAIAQGKQFEKTGQYEELFPGVAKDKLHALLEKNREEEQERIVELRRGLKKVHRVACVAKFRH